MYDGQIYDDPYTFSRSIYDAETYIYYAYSDMTNIAEFKYVSESASFQCDLVWRFCYTAVGLSYFQVKNTTEERIKASESNFSAVKHSVKTMRLKITQIFLVYFCSIN